MAANIELTAVYCRERIRFNDEDVVIECDPDDAPAPTYPADSFDLRPSITIKTKAEADELTPLLTYRFYGHWSSYKNRRTGTEEKQFVAKTWVKAEPHVKESIIPYLLQCPNIGIATANVLWQHFNGQAVKILREHPEQAAGLARGFTIEKAKEAAEYLWAEVALENCWLELSGLLTGRGFPKDLPKRLVKEFGIKAAKLIRQSPFLLRRFRGCGWVRVDKLYGELGGDPAAIKRQVYCLHYALGQDRDGNTWHSEAAAKQKLAEKIGGTRVRSLDAVKLGKRAGMFALKRGGDGLIYIGEGQKAKNEAYIASRVAEMLREPCQWPNLSKLDISTHQRAEAQKALQASIATYGGSPGTGKTRTTAQIVSSLIDEYGVESVLVGAPTGKAAVRLSAALESYGIPIRARTAHSLLGVKSQSESGGWGFKHNEDFPLDCRVLVLDEWSMGGVDLWASILRACDRGTQVLLVGDTNQLPPVEHGRPLYDMIQAGVPHGELTEIWRNAGSIVKACAAIRDGQPFHVDDQIDLDAGKNLVLARTKDDEESARRIVQTLATIRARGLLDPVWDCQVICAKNADTPLSVGEINKTLQAAMNPGGKSVKASHFRVGDKVVCTKNGFYLLADPNANLSDPDIQLGEDGDDVFVANGEPGRVVQIEEKLAYIALDSPQRVVKIFLGKSKEEEDADGESGGMNWQLAYGITCHKSQGSEYKLTLAALDRSYGARMICSKQWLYTILSRGKMLDIMVGDMATAAAMCRVDAISKRKTFLKELIQEAANHDQH